jgi:hypothetical protein
MLACCGIGLGSLASVSLILIMKNVSSFPRCNDLRGDANDLSSCVVLIIFCSIYLLTFAVLVIRGLAIGLR